MLIPVPRTRLAIFSPNVIDQYSETFVRAHKDLPFDIRFYYHGWIPSKLESGPDLFRFSLAERIRKKFNRQFNLSEHALINSLKKEHITAVLVEYGPTACETLKLLQYLQLPAVVHFHGFDASHKPTIDQYGQQYKKVFAYANKVIAVSKKMREDLLKLGCPDEKIEIVTYGPNPLYLAARPTYTSRQFAAVGRFTDKKAPYLTILAFAKVVAAVPDAKLVMVGDGELLNTCKNLVTALKLNDSIEFRGVLSPLEIKAILEGSLAFVQHSVIADNGDSEGTPLSVLEAQAAALPVIATFHAGIPDVVFNNKTGLLVTEQDVNGMAANMIRVLKEEGLAEAMGSAGRQRIMAQFTLEKHLATLENIIAGIA